MSAPDPLTEPLPWCIQKLAVLEPLPPDMAALLGQADLIAWRYELQLAFGLPPEVIDNGCRGNQTPGGDLRPD